MPKKSAATRSAAQRQKPKGQKSFELVRQNTVEPETRPNFITELATSSAELPTTSAEPTISEETTSPTVQSASNGTRTATRARKESSTAVAAAVTPEIEKEPEVETTPAALPRSAAARLAARRQAAQRAQQRSAVSLISPEHFAYVRRDLITIAVLATIMFAAIIILYFTIGRA